MSARILLIADGSGTLSVLARLLRISGFEVTGAENLATALSRVSEDPPHRALVDIGVPDRLRLISELAKHGISGVALSANCDAEYDARCRTGGFVHLLKPAAFHRVLGLLESTACGSGIGDDRK